MAKPRRRAISSEILKMIGESAKQPPPTRARELYFDMNRRREAQDVTSVRPPRNPRIQFDYPMRDPADWLPGEPDDTYQRTRRMRSRS